MSEKKGLDTECSSSILVPDGGSGVEAVTTDNEEPDQPEWAIEVENLGGISELQLTLSPGITVLSGENATNRSSLLQSLAAGIGGDKSAAALKTDVNSGYVEFTLRDTTYRREYTKQGGTVRKDGTPYCDDPELVDTFVALFANNPARSAVVQNTNLRDLLMSPVDTDEINREITDLKTSRSSLEDTISRIERRQRKLPELEQERQELEEELTAQKDEIERVETVIDDFETAEEDTSEIEKARDELEGSREELSAAEREAEEIDRKIEFRETERADLIEERDDIETELGEFDDLETLRAEISELSSEIEQSQARKEEIELAVEDLQAAIQANENLLDGTLETLNITSDNLTAALDPDSQVVQCWTCGMETERGHITEQIQTLRGIVTSQRNKIREIEKRLSELQDKKDSYTNQRDQYESLCDRRDELNEQIQRHKERITELQTERSEKQDEIDDIAQEIDAKESEIADLETGDEDNGANKLAAAHQKLTELERERGRIENQLEETVREIEEIQSLKEKKSEAEAEKAEITDQLEQLRGRIDQLEAQLVETLNEMMEDLIELLDYRNIARVWVQRHVDEGETGSEFVLHIVREDEEGSVYEDTAETLSESEREVIGVVVALAGYLVHDIDRNVPFIIFDSVEIIDGERMAKLLDYIETRTEARYLVVAMLSKDTKAVRENERMPNHELISSKTF